MCRSNPRMGLQAALEDILMSLIIIDENNKCNTYLTEVVWENRRGGRSSCRFKSKCWLIENDKSKIRNEIRKIQKPKTSQIFFSKTQERLTRGKTYSRHRRQDWTWHYDELDSHREFIDKGVIKHRCYWGHRWNT